MSDTRPAPPLPAFHRNQQLFSDYYLNEILPWREDWARLADSAAPVQAAIQSLLEAYHPRARAS